MKHILFKKLSYNITKVALSVLASISVMTVVAYAASTVGTNFSADGTLSVTATSTLSSDLRVDTNTLVVDSFNDRVGIGTTSPYAKLSVAGEVVGGYFTATTTTATSTFGGGLAVETSGLVYDYSTNNVGINTTSPAQKLDVNGFINTNGTTGGYRIDNNLILQASTTNYSTLIGYQAGRDLKSDGLRNTFIGYQSGLVATSTDDNVFIGYASGDANMTGNNNTTLGSYSLGANTTGSNNIAVGYASLNSNVTGSNNIAIGYQSGYSNTSGLDNVAIGLSSMYSNSSGNYNASFGRDSLYLNTTGSNNLALGMNSLQNNYTGTNNASLGYQTLRYPNATSTTAVGVQAGYGVNGQSYFQNAVLLGYRSGYGLTTGNNNILLGYQAGDNLTTGGTNIVLGYNVDAPSASSDNFLNIGNIIFGTNIDGTGTTLSSGNIGIGTSTPQKKLTVSSGASATTTVEFGDIYSGTGKTCFNIAQANGSVGSFYFANGAIVVENNICR